jgi:hypothetical protein
LLVLFLIFVIIPLTTKFNPIKAIGITNVKYLFASYITSCIAPPELNKNSRKLNPVKEKSSNVGILKSITTIKSSEDISSGVAKDNLLFCFCKKYNPIKPSTISGEKKTIPEKGWSKFAKI